MTTIAPHDLPAPDGAEADVWEDDTPQPYRVLYGASRGVVDRPDVIIQSTALQYPDGRIDDGSVLEAPQVYVEVNAAHNGLSGGQTRELAARLLEAADEVDGWVSK
jgi:hypothetical protein